MSSINNGDGLIPITTETGQSRYLMTDNNRETDESPEENKLLSLVVPVTQGQDITVRQQGVIDPNEIDELFQQKRSFPKMLGENMNCLKKLFLLHFAEYCFTVKKQVIDKQQRLSEQDLPQQRKFEKIDLSTEIAQKDINKLQGEIKWHEILIILMKGELRPLIYLSVLGFLVDSISRNLITVIMQWLFESVEDKDTYAVYCMGTALVLTNLVGRLAHHHGYLKGEQFSSKARLLLKGAAIGNVLNIITSDLDTLEKNPCFIFQIFVLPINFIFAVVIMWLKYDGSIGLLPLGITFVLYPLQIYISNFLGKYLTKFKLESDKRLKITNELVDGIRLMKMYAWENAFKKLINVIRIQECRYQFIYQLGYALSRSIIYSSQLWASCSFFIILFYSGHHDLLTIPNMISTIQLLNLYRSSCVSMFQYAITSYVFQKISFTRIAKLFNMKNIELQSLDEQPQDIERMPFGIIKNFSAYWNKQEPVFQNFTLSLNPGQFWGLIGPVGCGKSTFLMRLLKEIPYYKGLISQTNALKIAYVEQEPFIFPDSIRYNITFGREFNKELYQKVLYVTRLIQDINNMENQDHTVIGEKGVTLSGGQRARIALARALYSCADVYLLDDPISAVDSKVAKYLYTRALNSFIYEYQTQELGQQPIVVLATHQIQYALRCTHIAMIDKGQLAFQGTTHEFRKTMQYNCEKQTEDQKIIVPVHQIQLIENPIRCIKQSQKSQIFNDNFDKSKIYFRYFKMWNFYLLFVVLLFNCGFVVVYQIYLRMVVSFDNKSGQNDQKVVISYLLFLTLGGFIISFLKYILAFAGCQNASTQIHDEMIESLIKLPIQYFDATPSGRLINNFSIDQNLADIQTNAIISEVIEIIMGFIITLVTIGVLQLYFLIIVFFLLLGNYIIFNFFNQLIGQSKDIDLKLRGPQVDYVKKTLMGIVLIRTYNKALWFQQQFIKQSNQAVMALLNFYHISRLFQATIEATGLIVQILGVYLVIYLNGDNLTVFSQQILLLSSFNDQITWGLKQLITFETQLITYNRMFKLIVENQEADHYKKQDEQLINFPQHGTVEFKNVKMRYNKFSGLVLNGLTIKIAQGMKVGCVGRTGAGKSTIILSIIQIEIEDESDSFIKISGIDIRTIGLKKLRSSIGIIPQTPFIITGTIRQNLDPFNEFKDEEIFEVLKETRLKEVVDQLTNQLNEQMNEQLFSTGQIQLICLARLILRKKKIVALDEATANLDMKTDEFIQHLIKTKLKESTVITIAHRLNTIADYDRILVMENGVAVEFDTPFDLLACDVDSQCIDRDTEFAKLVQNTGQKNCQEIFNISKQAFMKTQFPSTKKLDRNTHDYLIMNLFIIIYFSQDLYLICNIFFILQYLNIKSVYLMTIK